MTSKAILLFICFFVPFVHAVALAKTVSFLIEQSARRNRDKSSRIDILFIFCLTTYSLIMVGSGCGHLIGGLL